MQTVAKYTIVDTYMRIYDTLLRVPTLEVLMQRWCDTVWAWYSPEADYCRHKCHSRHVVCPKQHMQCQDPVNLLPTLQLLIQWTLFFIK